MSRPLRGGTLRHVEVQDSAPLGGKHEKTEQAERKVAISVKKRSSIATILASECANAQDSRPDGVLAKDRRLSLRYALAIPS